VTAKSLLHRSSASEEETHERRNGREKKRSIDMAKNAFSGLGMMGTPIAGAGTSA
jgi:hypothetical protein